MKRIVDVDLAELERRMMALDGVAEAVEKKDASLLPRVLKPERPGLFRNRIGDDQWIENGS